jgi:hypothetical protein
VTHLLERLCAADATPEEIRRGVEALAARSCGPIRTPDTWYTRTGQIIRPSRDGILCQRLFGPIEDFRCACGALSGTEHEGETCARCGVLCGSSRLRDERWAHVEVPGVLHPGAFPAVARALGWTEPQLRAVLANEASIDEEGGVVPDPPPPATRHEEVDAMLAALDGRTHLREAGVLLLRDALGAELAPLVLTAIPVPPPGRRPLVPPAGGPSRLPHLGPIDEALLTLLSLARRWQRLTELDAPPIILANEAARTQRAFEAYLEAFRLPPDAALEPVAGDGPVPLAVPIDATAPEDCRQVKLLWIDDRRILLSDGVRAEILEADTGARIARCPTSWWRPHAVQGDLLVCVFDEGCLMMAEDGELQERHWPIADRRVALWDLGAARWAEVAPPALRIRVAENDQPEELFVVDVATGARRELRYGGDRPAVIAVERTGRYAWVGEDDSQGIVDLETAWAMLDLGCVEIPEGDPHEDDDEDDDEDDEVRGPAALGLRGDDWWWLHERGWIGCNDAVRRPVVGRWAAAGFDAGAERLALLVDGDVVVVRVEDGAPLARWRWG